jgi:hypothetical protein
MLEKDYQTKIIKAIEKIGGHVVNGQFSKKAEHDLQCGYPFNGRLYYLTVEVKTKESYIRVMKGKYHNQELAQKMKIDKIRAKGGLSLFAYEFKQVKEYVEEELSK